MENRSPVFVVVSKYYIKNGKKKKFKTNYNDLIEISYKYALIIE